MNAIVQIRKCRETEIVRTGEFYDEIVRWLDTHINYPRWMYRIYPSEDSVREKTKEGAQYICVQDEKIVGAFVLDAVPQGSYQKGKWQKELRDGTYMVLHALAVDPDMRREGIASKIIRFCVDKAQLEGYKAIRLDTAPDNYPAKALFEKNGFTYAGDADLERAMTQIPIFSLYELNW